MSTTPETGAGVAGADTYAAQTWIDAYWTARPHLALATTWAAASTGNKDGAAREATAYIEGTFGPYFRGVRRGFVQGLEFPRTAARDDASYALPDLPECLKVAVAELAARALSAPLAPDIDAGARIRSQTKKVGPIEKTTEYFDAGSPAPRTTYGIVGDLLAPILNGRQPQAPNAQWAWA